MTHLKDNKGYGYSQNTYIPLIQGFLKAVVPPTPTPPPPGGGATSGDPSGYPSWGGPRSQDGYWPPGAGGHGCCPNSCHAQDTPPW